MMTIEVVGDVMGSAFRLILIIALLAILPSLLTGLLVSIFQATTQINEQTLSFLPRMAVTLLMLIFAGKWMLTELIDFTRQLFEQAAQLVL
ncbi:flagellar biosynthesis protein FliQ [Pantoea sp. A4]|uniref:flagellar biosynthesis protein FliQ n=1 Tax=Pantoea sp. A4 TaxID=1225184 RepID=UPI00035EAE3B|nr:flagellar biosynthesis protein FliQ [Pantoea sp. A4]